MEHFLLNIFLITIPEMFIIILWGMSVIGHHFHELKYRILLMAIISALASDLLWYFNLVADFRVVISFFTIFATYLLLIKRSWKKALTMTLIVFVSVIITETLTVLFYSSFITYDQILTNLKLKFLVTMTYLLPLFIGIILIQRKNSSLSWFRKSKGFSQIAVHWFVVILLTLLQFFMIIFLNYSFLINGYTESSYNIVYQLEGLPLFSIILVLINIFLIAVITKIIRLNTKQEVYTTEINYNEHIENLLKKLKMERHDFINELQTINGMLQAKMYGHLESYVSDITKGIRYVNRAIKIKNIPVSAYLHTTIEQIEANGVKVDVKVNTDDTFASIKGYDLVKIISNLLDNATRAVTELKLDNPSIEIYWGKENSTGIIRVANNGPKIDKNLIDVLFDEGFSTKKNKENSGYGLYIVKSIVNKYRGIIEVESTDEMTSFIIKLPL